MLVVDVPVGDVPVLLVQQILELDHDLHGQRHHRGGQLVDQGVHCSL